MESGELVEAEDAVRDNFTDKKSRQTAKGKTVYGGAGTLLNCAYRTLNVTDVAVGGDGVDWDGGDVITQAQELLIRVERGNEEAARAVRANGVGNVLEHVDLRTVGDWMHDAML